MVVPSLFVPEQSPVADRASLLMVRPWLEWTRRVTQAIQQLAQTTGGGSVVTAQFQYRFSNSEMWPVASQRLQLNAAHPYTAVTHVGVSKQVDGGADVSNFLSRIPVGSRLYIQQNDNSDAYVDVEVIGAPADQGLYFTIPVSWLANGPNAIANNAAVSMFALMGGGGGGGGTVAPHHLTHEAGGSDVISVSDSQLSSNVALRNAANVFTQDQTIQKGVPALLLSDTAQPVDARLFQIFAQGQQLIVRAATDAGLLQSTALVIERSGDVLVGHILRVNGNLEADGDLIVAADSWTTGLYVSSSIHEAGRSTPLGYWTPVLYAGANFTTNSAGSWTVTAGNVVLNRYTVIGNTLVWNIQLSGTVVNAAGTYLQVRVPGLFSIASVGPVQCGISYDNGVDTKAMPFVASPTHIGFRRLDNANWGNSGGATHIYALVTAELL